MLIIVYLTKNKEKEIDMIRKIDHYTDFLLTQEYARKHLQENQIVVTWYTNHTRTRSVVHSHPYYEAVFSMSGYEVTYSVDGDQYVLHPGEVILFPKEIYHAGSSNFTSDTSERLVIQIDGDFWLATAKELGIADADWNHTVTILNANAAKAWDLRGLFERMNLNASYEEQFKATAFRSNLSEFFMIICQIAQNSSVYTPSATNALVEKTVQYIREHYTEPELNVAQIVDYTYTSRGHLSRVFKEYTAESIHSYITDLRMQHCRQLIANGKTILDACNESGFSDYSSFYKTFRKLYGITPVMYRSKLKELGQLSKEQKLD